MKICTKCKCPRRSTSFTKDASRKDGLNCWCKNCTRKNCANEDPLKRKIRSDAWYKANISRKRQSSMKWLKDNPGKAAAYSKKWRVANPEKSSNSQKKNYQKYRAIKLAADKQRRESSLEKFLERERKSYQRNKETALLKNARWRKANPERVAALSAKRRSAKSLRTPLWLTVKQHETILNFFKNAHRLTEETGVVHHVDHIIPLRGKLVSGLHVPWNLQILVGTENLRKGNRYAA